MDVADRRTEDSIVREHRLLLSGSARLPWAEVLLPWLQNIAGRAWLARLRSAIVLPTRGHVVAARERLVAARQSDLGIYFLTPAALRERLYAVNGFSPAPSADLQLLLAIAAEEVIATSNDDAVLLAARAVSRAPGHLLHTIERFVHAGWDGLSGSAFAPIADAFRARCALSRLQLNAQLDRAVAKRAASQPPIFDHVFIAGFDSGHWPHWWLLKATAMFANRATVLLSQPAGDLTDADAAWFGSWEQLLGAADPIGSKTQANDLLFSDEELGRAGRADVDYTFAVGRDVAEEARAIGALCARFLTEPTCARVGVVFPASGALSRLVSHELSHLRIHHNDTFARSQPAIFEAPDWLAWKELQRSPRMQPLQRFLESLGEGDLLGQLSVAQIERVFARAFSEVLIDDVDILLAHCAEGDETDRAIAAALAIVQFLPETATFAGFLEATTAALAKLGWSERAGLIAARRAQWMDQLELPIPRTLFLRWLDEVATTVVPARDAFGDAPYAPVQLVSVVQAAGQEWSHLILAGMNEGNWPANEAAEFARETEIDGFNAGIRRANIRAVRTGRFGEGHESVAEDRAWYLGPNEQRNIAQRQLAALLECADTHVAITASLLEESAPDRVWNPSEMFTRLYYQRRKTQLSQAAFRALQEATAQSLPTANAGERSVSVQQMRAAYDARRNAVARFAEYDFALREPLTPPPPLRVTEIDRLVSAAAIVWLRRYVGVEPRDVSDAWSASAGIWVHHWLAGERRGRNTFVAFPAETEFDRQICEAAEARRRNVERLCRAAGKSLPDWWESGWQNARCMARHLAAKLASADDWRWIASEWEIDSDQPVEVAPRATLRLHGRIDAVLSRAKRKPDSLGHEVWVIDYKTGASKQALDRGLDDPEKRDERLRKKLLESTPLQLAIYGLAARQLGAENVLLSVISPGIRPIKPQLSVADLETHAEIFKALAEMQTTGIFGMLGPIRSQWTHTPAFPLATLAIDEDVLKQRWELTHPALVRDEEDFAWWAA